jgi:Phage capsid protein
MSNDVIVARSQAYTDSVQLLLQQRGSRFRAAVMEGHYRGKAAKAVEQIGAVSAQKRTTRHGDTPLIETPHSARWVFPTHYEWADLIDDQDKLETIVELTSPYSINGAAAMSRSIDDEIVPAFFGGSRTGENGSDTTAFDTNQVVAVDEGATGATGLNVAKLRAAKKRLMANEVDIDNDPLYVALTAEQHDDMLNEIQAVSLDFNTKPVLVDGRITAFMGFNFVHSERLDVDGGGNRRCPAWAKSGMHLGIWNDIEGRVTERDDKSFATQVYVKGTFGATRAEEGKVIEIKCDES